MFKTIKSFGSNALLLEWDQVISEEVSQDIFVFYKSLLEEKIAGIIDIVPAYASLTIFFNPNYIKSDKLIRQIEKIELISPDHIKPAMWNIPVKYNDDTDEDMLSLMYHTNLSRAEIVQLHSHPMYKVCFIGFLPGFLYLSGMDPSLCMPRKKVPALRVPKGSVAIGGCQTGIYPAHSPGGWHIIGSTDFELIQFDKAPYTTLQPGDKVKFQSI